MPRHATKTSFQPGNKHSQWKGGIDNLSVLAPSTQEVYCRKEARKLMGFPNGLIVHHKDGNVLNRDEENLQTMKQTKHIKIHHWQEKGAAGKREKSKIRSVIKDVLILKKEGLKRREIAEKLEINFRMVKRCLSNKWRCQYEPSV